MTVKEGESQHEAVNSSNRYSYHSMHKRSFLLKNQFLSTSGSENGHAHASVVVWLWLERPLGLFGASCRGVKLPEHIPRCLCRISASPLAKPLPLRKRNAG